MAMFLVWVDMVVIMPVVVRMGMGMRMGVRMMMSADGRMAWRITDANRDIF